MSASPGFHFADEPRRLASQADVAVAVPAKLRRKRDLFAALAVELQLPDYFGWNWDALEECLRDLSWLPEGKGVVLVHCDLPFRRGAASRRIYLALLRNCLAYWQSHDERRLSAVFPASLEAEVAAALE
jgi:hypothetical protein